MSNRFLASVVLAVTMAFSAFPCLTACTRGDWEDQDSTDEIDNPGGDGPEVLFEPNTDPVPLIPFPNDLLTKEDRHSRTGLRINLPREHDTRLEGAMVEHLNELDGFSVFAPISVSFSEPLDLSTVTDQTVMLINADPSSSGFGQLIDLDLGRGNYPMKRRKPIEIFPGDPLGDPETGPDNIYYAPGNRADHYEDETDTLLIRPLVPLDEATRYAVVLTEGLLGEDREPIRPPENFEHIYFPGQFEDLQPVFRALEEQHGVSTDDLAFAWVFTTETLTDFYVLARQGLYGEGPMSFLSKRFPAKLYELTPLSIEIDGDGNDSILSAQFFGEIFDLVMTLVPDLFGEMPPEAAEELVAMESLDYFFAGAFGSPDFRGTPDRIFDIDPYTGLGTIENGRVTFMAAIPRPSEYNNFAQPPYPVVIYQHAQSTSRIDLLASANAYARHGYATIGIDAADHGPMDEISLYLNMIKVWGHMPEGSFEEILANAVATLYLQVLYPSIETRGVPTAELVEIALNTPLLKTLNDGRAEDRDGDGVTNAAEDFFTGNSFLSRDVVRQTVVDLFQLVRIIRAFGTDANNDGMIDQLEMADFNNDGITDLGGPGCDINFVGMSLGSFVGGLMLPFEPDITTVALNVPGGGLADMMMKSGLPEVRDDIYPDLFGPAIVGRPAADTGDVIIVTVNRDDVEDAVGTLAAREGDTIAVFNGRTKEQAARLLGADRMFVLPIPSDVDDPISVYVYAAEGGVRSSLEFAMPYEGVAKLRNSSEVRYTMTLAQWGLETSDLISFAPYYRLRPLQGIAPKNVLVQLYITDDTVPISSGVALGRALGLISPERNQRLIDIGVTAGEEVTWDEANAPVESSAFYGIRFHPGSKHEYMVDPTGTDEQRRWCFASKEQIAIFFETGGATIEDNLDVLAPGL